MFKKISKIFLTTFLLLGSVGTLASCNLQNSNNTDDPTPPVVNPIKENEVKIRSIKAVETVIEEEVEEQNTVSKMSARRLNSYVLTLSDEDETTDVEIPGSEITEPETNDTESGEVTDSENSSDIPTDESNSDGENTQNPETDNNEEEDNINFIIIYKSQTDITFTITLDNPEAYAIDALRVYCDDENAQIQVDGEFKPIAQESDGTRVVNWSSEDPYTKTYNIRTTSEDAINSFKVVDVRLAGHDKFQSKETEDTDLGNNELHIYKMDEDAYTLNVIENTFDYIKFNFNVKDEYKDIISNIKVDGLEMDEELEYWMLTESKNVSITYDYYLEEYDIKVSREDEESLSLVEFISPTSDTCTLHYNPTELDLLDSSKYSTDDIFTFSVQLNCPLYIDIISYYDYEESIIKNAFLAYFDIISNGEPIQFDLYFCGEKLVECTNSVVYEWNGTEKIEFKGHAFEYNAELINNYLGATDEGFSQSGFSWESQYFSYLLHTKCSGNFDLNSGEIYFYDLFRIKINGEIYKFESPYLNNGSLVKVEE